MTNSIDTCLAYRGARWQGVTPMVTHHRGLDPDGPFFLPGRGAHKLIERRTGRGTPRYSCDSLSQHFRKLHFHAVIEGASAMSRCGISTVSLANNGYNFRHINEQLGHKMLTA